MSFKLEITIDKINDLQVESIKRTIKRCKQAHFTNVHIRVNGEWEIEEADWIKHMEIKEETP